MVEHCLKWLDERRLPFALISGCRTAIVRIQNAATAGRKAWMITSDRKRIQTLRQISTA
jgi:hypothetical protein